MPTDKVSLKVQGSEADPDRFVVEVAAPAPFPRARFLEFLARLRVQSKDFGLVAFKLLGSQRHILDEMCDALERGVRVFLILKSRQVGASTFFLALDLFWAFEHRGLLGVFITHEEGSRDDFRSAVEVFFAETPRRYMVPYVRHNRNLLILKNASKFRYLIAGTGENSKRAGLGRSGAANFVHATEVAFYGSGDDLAEFRSQTSALYPHRLQIYETTANGFNHWHDSWEAAASDPSKCRIFVGWWRDERNALSVSDARFAHYMPDGTKTPLTALERKRVREVRNEHGFEISLQQIAWYRWHLASEKDGDQSLMDQENPWTPDDAFQSTGSKFFTAEILTDLTRACKKQPFLAYRYKMTQRFEETTVYSTKNPNHAELKIWEEASRNGSYALGCDPAYGSSDEADRSCISIWRCYADCTIQVAEYTTPEISTYQCAWALAHLAGYYGINYIMAILEITGPGQAVLAEIEKVQKMSAEIRPQDDEFNVRNFLQHMRHFFYRRIDSMAGGILKHWQTTENLKRRAMHEYKNGIELGRAIPRSVALCEEMRRLENDDGHIAAAGAGKDDRVVAGALAYQAWSTWVQPRMKNLGLTYAKAKEADAQGGARPPLDRLIMDYLRRTKIAVPTT